MRSTLLLPLAFAAVVGATGCGTASGDTEQTAFQAPRRDLTLRQSEPAALEVASPVELARAPVQPRATRQVRRARKPAESRRPAVKAAVEPMPALVLAASMAAPPAPAAPAEAPDPHALAPGQTVTVLTASTASASDGPSGRDWTDQLPPDRGRGTTIHGGRGGGCGPRGGRPSGGGFRGLR